MSDATSRATHNTTVTDLPLVEANATKEQAPNNASKDNDADEHPPVAPDEATAQPSSDASEQDNSSDPGSYSAESVHDLEGFHKHVVYEITVWLKNAKKHPMIITLRAPIPEPEVPLDKKVCPSSSGTCCKDTDAWVAADIDRPYVGFCIIRESSDIISNIILKLRFSKLDETEGVIQFAESMNFELDKIPCADDEVTKNEGPVLNSSLMPLAGVSYGATVKRVGTEEVANAACHIWEARESTEVPVTYSEEVCSNPHFLKSIVDSFRSSSKA
jgi:hypothetical protein